MLGIKPNNPYRAAGEGWLPGEDIGSAPAELAQRMTLGPLMRVGGRGFGFKWTTPTEMFFNSMDVQAELTRIKQEARLRMGAAPRP